MRSAKGQTSFARQLRREPTDAEATLWYRLRNRQIEGMRFRRRLPLGRYIVDFVCLERKLVVEVDGSQHTQQADAKRTAELRSKGYRVIRFWDNEVFSNMEGVLERVREELLWQRPHPRVAARGRL